MSHFLRTAAEIVGVVALAVATYGVSIGPTAAAAATSVGVSVATASTALAAATAGLGILAQLTAKKPQQIANPMAWQSDPQAGIPHIMGRCYSGGQIVYRQAYGKDDVNETLITVYSTGPIKGIENFYVDGVITLIDGYTAEVPDRGHLYVSTQLGAQPEAAQLGDLGPPGLTTASKLSGLVASSITLSYDAKGSVTFTTEPQCGFVFLGAAVYDPRKDSTYPGGDGPQRWNDETTWSFDGYDNPALKGLSYLIGYRQNGILVIGVGRPIASILVDQFVEAANVADANGWKLGGSLLSTDSKWQRLNDILASGGAKPIRNGASIGCMVSTPRVSLATIESSDIIGDWSVQAMQARRDRINAVVPRYMAEQSVTVADTSQKADDDGNYPLKTVVTWGMAAAAPIIVDEYVTFDGGQRQKGVDFPFVTGTSTNYNAPNQVAQLARYVIEDAREFGPITLPLKPRWMGYQAGDVVTGGASLTEQGLVGQDMLIMMRDRDPETMTVTMTAQSETAAKHAYALGQTTGAPATPSVSIPSHGDAPDAGSWTLAGGTISSAGGSLPAIIISGASDNSSADTVIFEYRPHVDGQADIVGWANAILAPGSSTGMTIGTVAAGQAYDAAISYRVKGVIGDRLILGPATAGVLSTGNALQMAVLGSWIVEVSEGETVVTANADGSVAITNNTRRYPDGHADVAVTGATIASGLAAGATASLAYDDPTRVGGAVTYVVYANDNDAHASAANPGRHYMGYFSIPSTGSAGGGGGGVSGGRCVTDDTPILMADAYMAGPGMEKVAADVKVGDWVWTQHETTMALGAYQVTVIEFADEPVFKAAGYPRATAAHLFWKDGGWVRMDAIGTADGTARIAKITVDDAHTYVSAGVLSHNIKANSS